MRHVLGDNTILGYCTNVHAGADLAETTANLETHAVRVKSIVCPDEPMGVGLWLSAKTARQLIDDDKVQWFADWLAERGLLAYTINGFPYGDFHRDVVKLDVYTPTWKDDARLQYTLDLANILTALLGDDAEGSISTLPIGWGPAFYEEEDKDAAAAQLAKLADELAGIEQRCGKLIHVCLEPEPGCLLDTAADVAAFYEHHLLPAGDEARLRRHLRVCHDVCHSAVMFEPQEEAIATYDAAGIAIGKVQLSAAVRALFDADDVQQRFAVMDQLKTFDEKRYLHQTVVDSPHNFFKSMYTDLPEMIEQEEALLEDDFNALREARVHFHVPLFAASFDLLESTQPAVVACLEALRGREVRHFEVETYAWDVLPAAMQADELAAGIARELQWVSEAASEARPAT